MSALIIIAGPNSPYNLIPGVFEFGFPLAFNVLTTVFFESGADLEVTYTPDAPKAQPVSRAEKTGVTHRSVRNASVKTGAVTNSYFTIDEYVVHLNPYTPLTPSDITANTFELHINNYNPPVSADISDTTYSSNFQPYNPPINSTPAVTDSGVHVKTAPVATALFQTDIGGFIKTAPTIPGVADGLTLSGKVKTAPSVPGVFSIFYNAFIKNANVTKSAKKNSITARFEPQDTVPILPHSPNTYQVEYDSTFTISSERASFVKSAYIRPEETPAPEDGTYRVKIFPGGIGHGNMKNR